MAMSRKGKGLWIAVPSARWTEERFASMSKNARCAWLMLTMWSKESSAYGRVTKWACTKCGVDTAEVDELLGKGYLAVDGDGWVLTDWADWQATEDEVAKQREHASASGKASKSTRPKPAPDEAPDLGRTISCDPTWDVETMAAEITRAWPAATGNYGPESPRKCLEALREVVQDRWPALVARLNDGIRRYEKNINDEGMAVDDARRILMTPAKTINAFLDEERMRQLAQAEQLARGAA